MFEDVQAEVDALIEMGFGSESLAEVFRKKGAAGIRSLWSKEVEKSEKREEYLDRSDKEPYQNMPYGTSKASGGSVKKNYAYGGRVAKMSSEKS